MDINLDTSLVITKTGELVAIIHNNMKKRSQVFYECKEMGIDDIKQLLEKLQRGDSLQIKN